MAKVSVLTNGGEAWAAGRLAGTLSTTGAYVGWGTGAGTATKSDSSLFTEDAGGDPAYARVSGSVTVEGSGADAAYQVVGTLTANADKTITNAGNFTASTSGTLVVHTSFDPIDLNVGDQITFTITVNPS